MDNSPTELSLNEICDAAGITQRTARYYIQQGLLPSPGLGRNARYAVSHLNRLRLIKALQEQHLPLAEIRSRLESLPDNEVLELLRQQKESEPPASAADYVRSVLERTRGPVMNEALPPQQSYQNRQSPPASQPAISTWERIPLSPDIEIHVRRPLARVQNRKLDSLLKAAENIFKEDPT